MMIRRVEDADLRELAQLCAEHAVFEKSSARIADVDRLRSALFVLPARLHAWVATGDTSRLLGYASATLDFSTWSAKEFVHLDCLFVREEHRGGQIGQALFAAVRDFGRSIGASEVQWQTPDWNIAAQRFYERLNAHAHKKVRYVLAL